MRLVESEVPSLAGEERTGHRLLIVEAKYGEPTIYNLLQNGIHVLARTSVISHVPVDLFEWIGKILTQTANGSESQFGAVVGQEDGGNNRVFIHWVSLIEEFAFGIQ